MDTHTFEAEWEVDNITQNTTFNDARYVAFWEKQLRNILESWRLTSPREFMPSKLLESTPFSCALLLRLKYLAAATKNGNVRAAHDALVREVETRVGEPTSAHAGKVDLVTADPTKVGRPAHKKKQERRVRENRFGVTLLDAEKATEKLEAADPTKVHRKKRMQMNEIMQKMGGLTTNKQRRGKKVLTRQAERVTMPSEQYPMVALGCLGQSERESEMMIQMGDIAISDPATPADNNMQATKMADEDMKEDSESEARMEID